MGADLPAFTQLLLDMSNFLQKTWWAIILGMIGTLVAAEFVAGVFEVARYGDQAGAFIGNVLAAPLREFLVVLDQYIAQRQAAEAA